MLVVLRCSEIALTLFNTEKCKAQILQHSQTTHLEETFYLLIIHDSAGLDSGYQNLLLLTNSCFWQCLVSEGIALAFLPSHTADDESFQGDEIL